MIHVEVKGQAVRQALDRLSRSVSDVQPALENIGAAQVDRIHDGFKRGASPWGERWKSLGQAAIMSRLGHRKDAFGKSGKISAKGRAYLTGGVQPLLDTGRLRSAIHYRASGRAVEVGVAGVKYATTHQFGASKGAFGRTRRGGPTPWGDIPARPFLPIRNDRADLPAAWKQDVIDLLSNHIRGAINHA